MAFPTIPADWSYKLGLAFLEAAVSCEGAECGRRFVSDGSLLEQPPPGTACACQLVAVVSEGYETIAGAKCGMRRVAEIRLVLDLCTVPPPGDKAIPDPVKVNAQAQKNASLRWLMMKGLVRAWKLGELSAIGEELGPLAASTCERIIPAPWRLTRSTGGLARWESTWRFQDDL